MTHDHLPPYRYEGARVLVYLHEASLREFVTTWHRAEAIGVTLPETEDPAYLSLETLLFHVCGAARGYMMWMCEVLGLPKPPMQPLPPPEVLAGKVEDFVDHVLEQWRTPLADVPAERFEREEFASRWKTTYCMDAMLEHAVLHPVRHSHQLKLLMEAASA